VKRAAFLTIGLAASLAVSARPAAAYVRYVSESGKPFEWPQSCVALTAYPNDLTAMMTLTEILSDVNAAAAAWSKVSNPCTYLMLNVSSSGDPTPHAANDGRNNIIFRTTNWCKLTAAGDCDPSMPYDPAALALTSVSASTSTGTIKDADIEINANRFHWADLVMHAELATAGMSVHDLQNALTHEMGHLIGLDHTCYLQPPPLIDNNGNPTPDCNDAGPDIKATTMYPSANPGDVDKRTLAPDDQQAVCEIYPASMDPMVCAPMMSSTLKEGCACAAGGAVGPAALLSIAGAAGLLAARARRRRRPNTATKS